MTKLGWQDHFKDVIKNAETLYSKDSTEVSLLLFCLRSKMLPLQTYLEWAKENYQLPVLSEKFFEVYRPQQEFYKKWQDLYKWSVECLPIAVWEDVLIVACLQIPLDYKSTTPTVFVLVSHDVLQTTWEIFRKSSPASETDMTDMSALAATIIAPAEPTDLFNTDGEVVLEDKSLSEEIPEELELPGDQAASEGDAGTPEGFFGESPTPAKGPRTVQPLLILKENSKLESTEEKPPASPEIPAKSEKLPPHPTPAPSPAPVAALATAPSVAPLTALSSAPPVAPPMAKTPELSTATYLLEKMRQQGKDRFDKDLQAHFHQLKTFFKKSMLLAVDEKDQFIKPIFWDGDDFNSLDQQNSEFNLGIPSIFKIVNSTQKPYHGFVILNDLNESFFESWNHGQIPDHVTIVPLLKGDVLTGMLMGFGEKSSYNKTVLHFTEKVAKDVAQKIFKNPSFNAA